MVIKISVYFQVVIWRVAFFNHALVCNSNLNKLKSRTLNLKRQTYHQIINIQSTLFKEYIEGIGVMAQWLSCCL